MNLVTKEELSALLTAEDLGAVSATGTPGIVMPNGSGDALDLVVGWALNERKLNSELDASLEDPRTWGAEDFLGAMYTRDRLQRVVERLPISVRMKISALIKVYDDEFAAFTELDTGGLLRRAADHAVEGRGWWWQRVPVRGPSREELDSWRTDRA